MTLFQYSCDCGCEEFEVWSNEYELKLDCTRCGKSIYEREDE